MKSNSEELATVNTETGEIVKTTPRHGFPVVIENGIKLIGGIRQWRADCKAGVFRIGESDIRGNSLRMELIGGQCVECEILTYPRQMWWELLFVDSDGMAASLLFKGQSIRNFEECLRVAVGKEIRPEALILTAQMSKRTGKDGAYYALEFSFTENAPERVQQISDFAASNAMPSRLRELIAAAEKQSVPTI